MYCQRCFAESPNTSSRCIQCGEAFFSEKNVLSSTAKAKPKNEFGILGWIAGLAVGAYSGIFLLILLACTTAIWWLEKNLLRSSAQAYRTAIALQAGQTFMLMIFVLVMPLLTTASIHLDIFFLFDVAVPVAGLTWLVSRPGLKPIVFLTVFQACALVVNGLNLSEMAVGSLNHKALATHILWRCLALFMMWRSYLTAKSARVHSRELAS